MDSFEKISEQVKEISASIGQFYLQKNSGDYVKTREEIEQLRIKEIEMLGDRLNIKLSRPGLLIGPKGKNINELSEFLKLNIHIQEVDNILTYLCPEDYSNFEDDSCEMGIFTDYTGPDK